MAIDPETQHDDGKWKKGNSGNPSGRPNRKEWTKRLNQTFDDEHIINILYSKLHGMLPNPKDEKSIINLIKHPDAKKSFRTYVKKMRMSARKNARLGFNQLSDKDQVELLFKIINELHGKPVVLNNTEISTAGDTSINIEFIKATKE